MKILTTSLSGEALCWVVLNVIYDGQLDENHPIGPGNPDRPYEALAAWVKGCYISAVLAHDDGYFSAKCRNDEDFGPRSTTESLAILRAFACSRLGAVAHVPDALVLTYTRQATVCNGVLTTDQGHAVDLTAIQATLQKAFNLAGRANKPQILSELTTAYQSILHVTGQLTSVPKPCADQTFESSDCAESLSASHTQAQG